MHKNNNHERHDGGELRKEIRSKRGFKQAFQSLMSLFKKNFGGGDVVAQHILYTFFCLNNSYVKKFRELIRKIYPRCTEGQTTTVVATNREFSTLHGDSRVETVRTIQRDKVIHLPDLKKIDRNSNVRSRKNQRLTFLRLHKWVIERMIVIFPQLQISESFEHGFFFERITSFFVN